MRLTYILNVSVVLITALCDYSSKVYTDLVHYGHFAKLTSCISQGKIVENVRFPSGGCDTLFCYEPRNSDSMIIKIREAPAHETGTALVVVDPMSKEIIIAFRASVTNADWISDFKIKPVDYEPVSESWHLNVPKCHGCKVHSGFYRNLDAINEELVNYVTELYSEHTDYQLVIVGHSLGAALATLCGIEFKARGFEPLIFTYAGPKMFNPEMVGWVNQLFKSQELSLHLERGGNFKTGLIRVVHDGDYVPMLPPQLNQAGVEFLIERKELPHDQDVVKLTGIHYLNNSFTPEWNKKMHDNFTEATWELLHGFEHRTYFMTINKCEDVD